jgi:hypothetical protein
MLRGQRWKTDRDVYGTGICRGKCMMIIDADRQDFWNPKPRQQI